MFALKKKRNGNYDLILLVQSQTAWEETHNVNICEVDEEKAHRLRIVGAAHEWPFKDTTLHRYIEYQN